MATNRKEIVLLTQNQTNLEIKCRALKVCASSSHFIIKWSYSVKHLIKCGFSFPQITVSCKITSGFYGMGGLVSLIRLLLAFAALLESPAFYEQEQRSHAARNTSLTILPLGVGKHGKGSRNRIGNKKKKEEDCEHPPSYIIWSAADWCTFVPSRQIFTPPHVWDSAYILQWDNHASTGTPSTARTPSLSYPQRRTCTPCIRSYIHWAETQARAHTQKRS